MELTKAANLNVSSGVLQLAPATGVIQSGNFNVSAGAILQLTSGSSATTMSGTFTGTGAGQIQLTGGVITAEGGSSGLTFNFPSGLFRISGGIINTNNQTVTIQGAVNIEGGNVVTLTGAGKLVVSGTVTDSSTSTLLFAQGTQLQIAPTGTFVLTSDTSFTSSGGGFVQVDGVLRKSGGNGLSVIGVPVSNAGTVEVRRGTLSLAGGVAEIVAGSLNAGIWSAVGSSTVAANLNLGANINVIGVGATVKLNGLNAAIPSLATLSQNRGNFQLLGGATFTTAANLNNQGRITLSEASELLVTGEYVQTSGGRLATTLNGTLGRLRTTGQVTLSGALLVSLAAHSHR